MAGSSNASASGGRQPHPGTYQRYKLHTDRFLYWLKRSCGARPSNCKEIEEAVGSLASEPVGAQEVPSHVMGDLQAAIELREKASAFHRARGDNEDADATHRYFIGLLRWCRATLQPRVVPVDGDWTKEAAEGTKERQGAQRSSSSSSGAPAPKPPSNAFASLAVDHHDAEVNEQTPEAREADAASSSQPPPEPESVKSSSTGNPLLEGGDDDEKGVFAAVCFAMDYEAALEGVRQAWSEAKRGETTYIAAAAATSAAVKAIEGALRLLDLKNPRLSEPRELLKALYNSEDERTYRPLAKQMSMFGTLLLSMTTAFKGKELHPKIEDFGPRFDENKSPIPIPLSGTSEDDLPAFGFVAYEVAAAYNFWIRCGKTLVLSSEVDDALCPLLEKYFTDKKVNVALLFAVHAWLESVLATQREAWLGRTCCILRNEATRLKDVYIAALLKAQAPDETYGSWFLRDPDTKEGLKVAIYFCDLVSTDDSLFRYNPWLCGRAQHSLYAQFLHNGLQLLHSTERLKTLCHLYNGLLQTGRLAAPSPVLELVLGGLGEDAVFVSGRPSPGNLVAGLLLSCGVSATSASKIQKGIRSGKVDIRHDGRMDTRRRKEFEAKAVLRSFISNPLPEGTSIPEMLQVVKDDTMYDQTISRMLCLDCFNLHKICSILVLATVEQAGLGPAWRKSAAEVPYSNLKCVALDQTAGALLADLDVFALHGESRALSPAAERTCELLAKNLKNDFAATVEEVFFHVHAWTDLHRLNWGRPPLLVKDSPLLGEDGTENAWFGLMETLDEAKGKLSREEVQKFKHVTKEYPGVVTLMDMSAEFPSVVHHLAGGPAADPGLLDWVMQMGGFLLTYGPSGKSINGDTVAHSAARRGDVECMRVLLRAAPVLTLPLNNKKQTPLQVAGAEKHVAMARYLQLNATAYGVLPPGTNSSRLSAPSFQGVAEISNAPVPQGTNREPSRTRPAKKKGKGKKKNKK